MGPDRFADPTCKMNGVEPCAWLKSTLEKIAAGNPQSEIDELLPWNFVPASSQQSRWGARSALTDQGVHPLLSRQREPAPRRLDAELLTPYADAKRAISEICCTWIRGSVSRKKLRLRLPSRPDHALHLILTPLAD